MMEVIHFIGRYYFVLGLLAFNVCFATACVSIAFARRDAKLQGRRRETAEAMQTIAQYQTYVRYVGDLTLHNQAALRNRTAPYCGLKKVA
jgi:hypothetical protein